MRRLRIKRRTFLRGVAGTAIALPSLEIMEPLRQARADAAGQPCRFVFVQAIGTSLGRTSGAHFVPSNTGMGYTLPSSLAPLGPSGHDVQADVSVISGLEIPWIHFNDTPNVPAARSMSFHNAIRAPIVSGTSSHSPGSYTNNQGGQTARTADPQGPTAEWAVANRIGDGTVFPALVYGLEGGRKGRSQRDTNDEIAILRNAQQAYLNLVGDATSGDPSDTDPELEARRDLLFRRRLSALDLAADDSQRLAGRLGTEDRRRMDRYFTELRGLETRIQALRDFVPGAACQPADEPGGDPSGATQKVQLFNELIRMAFSCDLSRSAMVLYGSTQCRIDMGPEIGIDGDMHELTHSRGPQENMEAMSRWYVDLFGHLVALLRDAPDGLGGSLLDSTALVFVPAGGWGDDGAEGRTTAHSTINMAMLLAGRAGGLVAGQHLSKPGVHPTLVTTTAMQAVGAGDTLGEIQGVIPELLA